MSAHLKEQNLLKFCISNGTEFQFILAFRKWVPDIRPEYEFRCFVREKNLVGISQREVTAFYPSLLTQKDQMLIQSRISSIKFVLQQLH